MVSSSSESQKLVVSSSLLITVLELSYPARWRSSRLWPFIRGPGTPQRKPAKTRGKIPNVNFHVCSSPCLPSFQQITNIPHFIFDYITIFLLSGCWQRAKSWWHVIIKEHFAWAPGSAFPHRVAPCSLCAEAALSWRKLQTLFQSGRPRSPHCLSHWDCKGRSIITGRIRAWQNFKI